MTNREIEKLNNDLMIATTMLSLAVNDEEFDELTDLMEKRFLNNAKGNAEFLMQYAKEKEQFEVCKILKPIIDKLNKL